MSKGLPYSATQIVAGCAVVIALLGTAYAVGRSQAVPDVRTATPATAPVEATPLAPAPTGPTSARATTPAALPTQPAAVAAAATPAETACTRCGTVTEVRSERRQGEPSGLGAVGGAVLGGILGHQVGGGTGKQIATVGGAVAGGYAGHQIEKQQRGHTVWIVSVRQADGQMRRFERSHAPDVRAGDEVTLTDKGFVRR